MSSIRFATQNAVKMLARSLGFEIRYAFQNPSITSSTIYSPWFSADQVKCIFDVGANVGQSARGFANAFPRSTIRSFEPFPEAYRQLQRLTNSYRDRIKVYQIACGDTHEYVDVTVDPLSRSPLNQLHSKPNERALPKEQIIRIPVHTVDGICKRESVELIDILKTDTEGYDAKVLAGARGMLSAGRIRCVISEVGFIDDEQHTDFSRVFSFLIPFGYELAGIYEVSYLTSGRCDFANALFILRNGDKFR